jgi:hypothetical protein
VLDTLARAQLVLADYLVEHGGDARSATEVLSEARRYLDRSARMNPGHTDVWYQGLVAARIEAGLAVRDHADPTRALTVGRKELHEALALMPGSAFSYVQAARLDLLEAAGASRAGSASPPALDRALADAQAAVDRDASLPEAQLALAGACAQLAETRHACPAACNRFAGAPEPRPLNPRLAGLPAMREKLLRLCRP